MSARHPPEKVFVDRMTRVPERAVQMALAGHGRQVSSLLTPVAWMFVIAALLIALDSAAGVGVLVLLQRGIDSGVAAGDMSTIGICALLALCLVAIGLVLAMRCKRSSPLARQSRYSIRYAYAASATCYA
ncbi:hypothetical protein LFZ31_19955 [Salmonella enterica subsp. enterica serovar Newport str. S09097]|nr:hypothetical protein LFZ31_19955 [Salmonella enterica subsp. enterica serovar Newport str. S09097]